MYVKVSDVEAGDKLVADGGFTCINEGEVLEVKSDKEGLYVDCRGDGDEPELTKHYLCGQVDENGEYIGFTKAA